MSANSETESSTDEVMTASTAATQRKIMPKPEWRSFYHVIRDEQGSWLPIRTYTKRNARGAALSAAFKTESDEVAILDPYANRVSLYKCKHALIPEEKRTATQRARLIDRTCKVYVIGHYKLQSQGNHQLCLRDNRGRRPAAGGVAGESSAGVITTATSAE